MARGINRGRQRKEERRQNAIRIAEDRAKRTPEQQLSLLDQRLGKGEGAQKERKKLNTELQSNQPKKKTSKRTK